MLHTSALHIKDQIILCTCGDMFIEGHPRPDYVIAFSRHLTDSNRKYYG